MSLPERCEELARLDIPNFILSIALLIGMVISYLPQHIKICMRRSSEGLSPYYILLGTTSGTCAIANILVLPTSRQDMDCCRVISPLACTAGLLGIAQVGMQWACFFLITLLFLAFTPRPGTTSPFEPLTPVSTSSSTTTTTSHDPPSLRTAITVVTLSILHFIATFLISIIFLSRFPSHLTTWANILGLLCTILASIQYLPQIYTTYRLKHVGSLSIGTMLIQTPGAFILALSLAVRLGAEGWSAWLVYVVTGVLQGVLLVMAVIYERRDRASSSKGGATESPIGSAREEDDRAHDDENTPLLQERGRLTTRRDQAPAFTIPPEFRDGNRTASAATAPVAVQKPAGVQQQDEAEPAIDPKTGRRSSKWRWQKGDFSYKVW